MSFTPELLWAPAILLLLAALVWGMVRYRQRNRANDAVTEEATETLYDDPKTYDAKRKGLKKKLKRS
jgi:cytochrome c-type biogenesis protein CcmH/NrfF